MFRNIGRRYMTEQAPAADASKPAADKAQAPKRRALGDITNAFTSGFGSSTANDAKKDVTAVTKPFDAKPAFAPVASSASVTSTETLSEEEAEVDSADRSYMQRPSDDIDARDAGNPLLVTCYVNEMYDIFNAIEREIKVKPNYMSNQPYVNERMRAILVDWLVRIIKSTTNLFPIACIIFTMHF
jgi:Cyclin, N-terminal domain